MSKLREKGITLIVLIVTVIILLILVGVTIGQITGNKGLFNRVRKTVSQYENTQEQEDAGMLELETMLAEEREKEEELQSTTANQNDVLLGKTYYTGDKIFSTGTMPNHGGNNIEVTGEETEIPKGYYDGTGKVITKNRPSIDYGGGPIVASILAYNAGYSSKSTWLGLFCEGVTGHEDECYYNPEYISFKNATSGGSLIYNASQSTFSLTKNIRYTLLITATAMTGDVLSAVNVANIKITNGTTDYFKATTNDNGVIYKTELDGPLENLHFEASISQDVGRWITGCIIVMV